MHRSLNLVLGLGLSTLSSALPTVQGKYPAPANHSAPANHGAPATHSKLLIGGGPTGMVGAADFNGSSFKIVANLTLPGRDVSWLLFREGTNQLYGVDENSNTTSLFHFDRDTNDLTLVQNATGASGDVFLEFDQTKEHMFGSSFGEGKIDVWDLAPDTGLLTLNTQLVSNDALGPNPGRQEANHVHQSILDPSGRYLANNDLGSDTVLIVDTQAPDFAVTNHVRVNPPGCGARHAVFWPPVAPGAPPQEATHYILVCEVLSLVTVFKLEYTANTILFEQQQILSTFGTAFPPVNSTTAAAGEIQVTSDGLDFYISNRVTGNDTDSIGHFRPSLNGVGDLTLEFKDTISSTGLTPRMMSLSLDEKFLFCTNQDGENGLVAFKRNADGSLDPNPAAALPVGVFATPGQMKGPQFVQEI